MALKLRFLGAAGNVTGSRHLLEADGRRVLVDCGLYQERELRQRNWEPLPVPPASLDAILLTHAHLDHCGLLPRLAKDGFRGPVYCTPATAEISRIILLDAAKLQEEDAAQKRKRHERDGRTPPRPVRPLYTVEEARECFGLFSPVPYARSVEVAPGVRATFHEAGHVFGSAMITVTAGRNGARRTVLFSGDVGRRNMPILDDPTVFEQADYVLVESTYGDRLHESRQDVRDRLAEAVNGAVRSHGNVVIPAFALERSQDILYHLSELLRAGRIPHVMVFLDSPMAIAITKVFLDHPELYDQQMRQRIDRKDSPFRFPGLKMTQTSEESKSINYIRGTALILAGSGMCTGGRVKHHLVANIVRPECTILFVGYQAAGTLGREILDGAKEVRILGRMLPVRARVIRLHGFSAHADRQELLAWLRGLKRPPRGAFVVHGEPEAALSFRDFLAAQTGWATSAPAYGDEVALG